MWVRNVSLWKLYIEGWKLSSACERKELPVSWSSTAGKCRTVEGQTQGTSCVQWDTRTENVLTVTNICPLEDLRTQDGTTIALWCRTRWPRGVKMLIGHPNGRSLISRAARPTAWPLPAVKQRLSTGHGAWRMLCEECIKADKSSPEVFPGHGFQTVTGLPDTGISNVTWGARSAHDDTFSSTIYLLTGGSCAGFIKWLIPGRLLEFNICTLYLWLGMLSPPHVPCTVLLSFILSRGHLSPGLLFARSARNSPSIVFILSVNGPHTAGHGEAIRPLCHKCILKFLQLHFWQTDIWVHLKPGGITFSQLCNVGARLGCKTLVSSNMAA